MGLKKLMLGAGALLSGAVVFAEDAVATQPTVTLPTGVDVSTAITQAVTVLGGIVAVAIAGYCGFLLVRKAFRWIGKALG